MESRSIVFFSAFRFMKLYMKAVAATTSMMTYWTIVTLEDAQNEPAGSSWNVRLHWSMFTAYFWKGKMAE